MLLETYIVKATLSVYTEQQLGWCMVMVKTIKLI